VASTNSDHSVGENVAHDSMLSVKLRQFDQPLSADCEWQCLSKAACWGDVTYRQPLLVDGGYMLTMDCLCSRCIMKILLNVVRDANLW